MRVGLIAAVLLAALVQTPAVLAQEEERIPLVLGLSLNRTDAYLVGEPVMLSLHLTNWSDKVMNLQTNPSLESDLRIQVRTNMTRGWTDVKNPLPGISLPRGAFDLQPYESRAFVVTLLYDRQNRDIPANGWPKLVFDEESWFRIKVELDVNVNGRYRVTLDSHVDAEVKAPVQNSPEDLILGTLLLKRDEQNRLVFQKDQVESYQALQAVDDESRAFFERAVEQFPVNRYTPYFLYLLARSYDIFAEDERARAIGLFERLIREFPNFELTRRATENLAEIYDQIDQRDKANEIVQRLLSDPENPGLSSLRLGEKYVAPGMEYNPQYWMLTQ